MNTMLNKLSLYYTKDINLTHHSSDTLTSSNIVDHNSVNVNSAAFRCGDLKVGNIETTGRKHPLITAVGTAALYSNKCASTIKVYIINLSKLASIID